MLVDLAQIEKICEVDRLGPFGEQELKEEKLLTSSPSSAWRFMGQRRDEESGLYCFGQRYYLPVIGRWLTPDALGYDEGASGYLFARNNTFAYTELWGLMARPQRALPVAESWTPIEPRRLPREYAQAMPWQRVGHVVGNLLSSFAKQCIPVPWLRDGVGSLGHAMTLDRYRAPYQPFRHEEGSSCGFVEGAAGKPLSTAIINVNGMGCKLNDVKNASEYVAEAFGGAGVHYVHNSTHGFACDLLEVFRNMAHLATHPSRLLEGMLHQQLAERDQVVLLLHSQGGVIGDCALRGLSAGERGRTHVYTFGSAKMISPYGLASCMNYVSSKDPIPFIADPIGIMRSAYNGSLRMLPSSHWLPSDHAFLGQTYKDGLKKSVELLREKRLMN